MEFDYVCSVSLVETISVKYQYEFGNYNRNFVQSLKPLAGMFCLLNCLSIICGHVSVLDLGFYWISTFQYPLLLWVIPAHIGWLNWYWRKQTKEKAWIKYWSTHLQSDYLIYAKCRIDATEAVRKAEHCYEQNLVQNIDVNPKSFWKYIRGKTKAKCSLGNLQKSDGSLSSSDNETTDILNAFLAVFLPVIWINR